VISAKDLEKHLGKTLITGSGDSVLGADDKAGVAVIMESLYAILGDHVQHGPLTVIFFPDEENGELNIADFPPELMNPLSILLTVDGGTLGVVDTSCYSGRTVKVTFKGFDAHPGPYGDRIIPAATIAADFMMRLHSGNFPAPWRKSEAGSYQYAMEIQGEAAEATVICIPRSFDDAESIRFSEQLQALAERVVLSYPGSSTQVDVVLKYISISRAIQAQPWTVELLRRAAAEVNLEMHEEAITGGTDGAMMNMHYAELPCPNMGVGAHNIHLLTEFVADEDLDHGQRWLTQFIYQATCI